MIVAGDTLLHVAAGYGPFSAEDRAAAIAARIRRAAREGAAHSESIRVAEAERASEIRAGEIVLVNVTEADARAAGISREVLADSLARLISGGLEAESLAVRVRTLGFGVLWSAVATAVMALVLWAFHRIFPRIYRLFRLWGRTRIPSLRIQRLEILPAERIAAGLVAVTRGLRVILTVALVYLYVPLVFSFFPQTRGLAERIVDYVVDPVAVVARAIAAYLPNLVFILVIGAVTWYALRLLRWVFGAVEAGKVAFPGFYPDWATPTFKIVRVLVLAFAVIMIWPYLPRSDSAAFRGVAAFLGLLLTFGSASAIANVIGGMVMIYMRAFQVGDRVKISDTVGDVVEKSLLVTRVRTVKNVEITIPNAMVLGSHIINYSSTAGTEGLVLHTSVSIGYDVPWRRVHELLEDAAQMTEGILSDPAPFVLQTGLHDFYVTYELNGYTDRPTEMSATYSELHRNIQDAFGEAGVEILSPHHRAVRDGEGRVGTAAASSDGPGAAERKPGTGT